MTTATSNAERELTEMYQATIPYLEDYPWELEEDRLADLVVNLFAGIGINPSTAKHAVGLLSALNILMPRDLVKIEKNQVTFIREIFINAGMNETESLAAASALLKLGHLINNKWDGYIQKFLRSYGQKMVKELQGYLIKSGVEPRSAKRIATVWLQNVCNLPILLEGDAHISNFCSRYKITENTLVDTLDKLGLNACVADDLLALFNEPVSKNGGKKKNNHTTVR